MKNYTFNFEVVTLTTQFADAFNDIVVKRYNSAREANGQEIGVTFIYAPKQRVIYDLINKQNDLRLPIVSYNINSFSRDKSRVFNKLQGATIENSEGHNHLLQPVPINLGITLNVMTKYQLDMDQIISNFVPYNDPYVTVSWPDPYAGEEIRSIIEWDGSVNITYPMDQTAATPFSRVEAQASFKIKGWLFKAQSASIGKIHNIYADFFAVNDIYCSYAAMLCSEDSFATDSFIISGRPVMNGATPVRLTTNTEDQIVTITGNMFSKTPSANYFLSGSEDIIGTNSVYDFTTATYISSYIDHIIGVRIVPTVLSDTVMTLSINTGISGGFIDVIAVNDAGISKLSLDSYRTVVCPYSGYEACIDWAPWQPATINGIEVV